MTELRHLQIVILSMIKYIDGLCRDNNIEYYLLGGSAIGAIRHKGFIPWDDDLDIIMSAGNYERFIHVCKEQLDTEKFELQEGLKDWPLFFSKIRLKGTTIDEHEGACAVTGCRGIFIDIFKMDNISGNKLMAYWQYILGKYYLCYQLSQRTYGSASFKKHVLMFLSFPLKSQWLRRAVVARIEKYNDRDMPYWGFLYGRTRWKSGIISRSLFGKPLYVPFEDTMLPVPEHYHLYLTQVFGDYMKLPPKEHQVGLHMVSIDFGDY